MTAAPALGELLGRIRASDIAAAMKALDRLAEAETMGRRAEAMARQAVGDLGDIGVDTTAFLWPAPGWRPIMDTDECGRDSGECPADGVVGMTNTRVYEIILRKHNRPMHHSEIAAEAVSMGARFDEEGKTSIVERVRNALAGSKRFTNLGASMWWITGVPVPAEPSQSPSQPNVE